MSDENSTLLAIQQLGSTVLLRLDEQDKSAAERDKKLDGIVVVVGRLGDRVDELEKRVGSPTDPPTALIARQAQTSSHDLEQKTQTLEGKTVTLAERLDGLEKKVDAANAVVERIERAIVGPIGSWFRSIFATAAVRTAVTGLVLALLTGGAAIVGRGTAPASASPAAPQPIYIVLPEGGVAQ